MVTEVRHFFNLVEYRASEMGQLVCVIFEYFLSFLQNLIFQLNEIPYACC